MASVNDWAAKAAQHIVDEVSEDVQWRNRRLVTPSEERIAAIIATFAEPLMTMLRECKREHSRGYNDESCDYPPCPKSDELNWNEPCTCQADTWNTRIDAVLNG